ncbi:MAG: hypothetical protein JWM96_81, partial [Alphaproteobacteria bacterium]|nr:hypothetical protein [Alphaproteobacteria bacterium]
MKKHAWLLAIFKLNWANMISSPGAFWSMMLFMCLQNLLYFSLWVII